MLLLIVLRLDPLFNGMVMLLSSSCTAKPRLLGEASSARSVSCRVLATAIVRPAQRMSVASYARMRTQALATPHNVGCRVATRERMKRRVARKRETRRAANDAADNRRGRTSPA